MIEWGEILNLGVKKMDEQHKTFFDIVERMNLLIDETEVELYQNICTAIKALEEFVIVHFDYENRLMEKIGYPKLAEHQLEHNIFKAQIININTEVIKQNEKEYLLKILDFIVEWIILHIGKYDTDLAKYHGKSKLSL